MTRREFMFSITAAAVAGISTADAVKTIRSKVVKKAIKTAIFNHLYEVATPEVLEQIEKEVANGLQDFSIVDVWYDWKVKAVHDYKKHTLTVQVAVKHSKKLEYTIYSGEISC